jgi:hypothetical protein
VWARHQTVTDPAHRRTAARLRRDRLSLVRPPAEPAEPDVQIRRLRDYDDALGVDGGIA